MSSIRTDILLDQQQIDHVTRELAEIPFGVEKALSRSINKIGVAARKRVMDMVIEQINVRLMDLRQKNIKLTRASYSKLYAVLTVLGRRIPLSRFAARQTKQGVSYAIRRGGARTTIPHAFLATFASGHRAVALRTGEPRVGRRLRGGRGPGSGMAGLVRPRLPITERYGPSVPQVVEDAQEFASGEFQRLMQEKLAEDVLVQIDLLLKGQKVEADAAPF
jgi:hypothetical protein